MQGQGGGPATAEGKAIAGRNATTHGLTSSAPVIPDIEDPADWQRHLQGMMESLQPEGWHEAVLAERIAHFLWRSFRAIRQELAEIDILQSSAKRDLQVSLAYRQGTLAQGIFPEVSEDEVTTKKSHRLLPHGENLTRLTRYEAHLHRMYIQTLHELEAIQARRRGERPSLARLDISGPPLG